MKRRSHRNPSAVLLAPWALMGSGAVVLGWSSLRLNERAKLAEALGNNARIQTLRQGYLAEGAAPPSFRWILDEAWEAKADEVLPLFSTQSAEEGFEAVMATLPKPQESKQTQSTLDAIRNQLQQFGITLPKEADKALDVIGQAINISRGTPSNGPKTRPR